jgi:hypothetical protein
MANSWSRLKSWFYYCRYPLIFALTIISDRLFILWPYLNIADRSSVIKQACAEVYYDTLWWLSHIMSTMVTVLLFLCSAIAAIALPVIAIKAYWNYSEEKSWKAEAILEIQDQSAGIIEGVIEDIFARISNEKAQLTQWSNDLKGREIALKGICQRLGLNLKETEPEPEIKVDIPASQVNPHPAIEPTPAQVEPVLPTSLAPDNQEGKAAANHECPVDPADLPQEKQPGLPADNVSTEDQATLLTSENEVAAASPLKPEIRTVDGDSKDDGGIVVLRLGQGGNGSHHENYLTASSRGEDEGEDEPDEDEVSDPGSCNANFDDDPIIQAVIRFMTDRDKWEGRATELVLFIAKIDPEIGKKKPHIITRKINQAADYLMAHGISCDSDRSYKQRTIVLKRLDANFESRK